jgi:hypothetical protein
VSAVVERTIRVGLLTTLGCGIGDDLIREGVRAILHRVLPGCEPLYVNKWSQASLHERLEDERVPAADKYWESDLFVIAGAPVYWHLTGGRHRSLEAEWHRWAFADRILAAGDAPHPPLLNLGAGSGQPWGDDGSSFVEDAACAAFARELGWRASLTTVRDRVAASVLSRLDVAHRVLPCPSFLASAETEGAGDGPIGVSLAHLGGEFALDGQLSEERWSRECTALLAGLRKLRPLLLIAHTPGEARFLEGLAATGERVESPASSRGFRELYAKCGVVVSNHIEAAMCAAGYGAPSMILGNDTRALSGEPIGIPVRRSSAMVAGAAVEEVAAMLAGRTAERDRLLTLRDRALATYADLIAPVLERSRTPRRTTAPAPPARKGAMERTLAFITGCGRSGTTILGRILEHHGQVRYFNDRFDLWTKPFPFTDIWGYHAPSALTTPRVALDEEDARVPQPARDWFFGQLEVERGDRPVIVEKLAINNFRLPFLRALCPGAPLVNIMRHGVDVAHSIAVRAGAGEWYGPQDRKWRLLVEYAWAHGYGPLLRLCETPYHRGLLEWRMSVEAAERFFDRGPERVLRLRYEDLLADAPAVAERMRAFLGLDHSPGMAAFAAREVKPPRPNRAAGDAPEFTAEIAGPALERYGYTI